MTDFLGIYLRDHHAAGRAGMALARRVAEAVEFSLVAREKLQGIAGRIEEDFGALEEIMAALGVSPSSAKDTIAVLGERVGRLMNNGRTLERSPLSDVLELETLAIGIAGKEALWKALLPVSNDGNVAQVDLNRLIRRAQRQRRSVEQYRIEAARSAFGLARRVNHADAV